MDQLNQCLVQYRDLIGGQSLPEELTGFRDWLSTRQTLPTQPDAMDAFQGGAVLDGSITEFNVVEGRGLHINTKRVPVVRYSVKARNFRGFHAMLQSMCMLYLVDENKTNKKLVNFIQTLILHSKNDVVELACQNRARREIQFSPDVLRHFFTMLNYIGGRDNNVLFLPMDAIDFFRDAAAHIQHPSRTLPTLDLAVETSVYQRLASYFGIDVASFPVDAPREEDRVLTVAVLTGDNQDVNQNEGARQSQDVTPGNIENALIIWHESNQFEYAEPYSMRDALNTACPTHTRLTPGMLHGTTNEWWMSSVKVLKASKGSILAKLKPMYDQFKDKFAEETDVYNHVMLAVFMFEFGCRVRGVSVNEGLKVLEMFTKAHEFTDDVCYNEYYITLWIRFLVEKVMAQLSKPGALTAVPNVTSSQLLTNYTAANTAVTGSGYNYLMLLTVNLRKLVTFSKATTYTFDRSKLLDELKREFEQLNPGDLCDANPPHSLSVGDVVTYREPTLSSDNLDKRAEIIHDNGDGTYNIKVTKYHSNKDGFPTILTNVKTPIVLRKTADELTYIPVHDGEMSSAESIESSVESSSDLDEDGDEPTKPIIIDNSAHKKVASEAARQGAIRIAAKEAEQQRMEQRRVIANAAATAVNERARIAAEEAERARIAAEEAERARIAAEEAERARIAAEAAEQAQRVERAQQYEQLEAIQLIPTEAYNDTLSSVIIKFNAYKTTIKTRNETSIMYARDILAQAVQEIVEDLTARNQTQMDQLVHDSMQQIGRYLSSSTYSDVDRALEIEKVLNVVMRQTRNIHDTNMDRIAQETNANTQHIKDFKDKMGAATTLDELTQIVQNILRAAKVAITKYHTVRQANLDHSVVNELTQATRGYVDALRALVAQKNDENNLFGANSNVVQSLTNARDLIKTEYDAKEYSTILENLDKDIANLSVRQTDLDEYVMVSTPTDQFGPGTVEVENDSDTSENSDGQQTGGGGGGGGGSKQAPSSSPHPPSSQTPINDDYTTTIERFMDAMRNIADAGTFRKMEPLEAAMRTSFRATQQTLVSMQTSTGTPNHKVVQWLWVATKMMAQAIGASIPEYPNDPSHEFEYVANLYNKYAQTANRDLSKITVYGDFIKYLFAADIYFGRGRSERLTDQAHVDMASAFADSQADGIRWIYSRDKTRHVSHTEVRTSTNVTAADVQLVRDVIKYLPTTCPLTKDECDEIDELGKDPVVSPSVTLTQLINKYRSIRNKNMFRSCHSHPIQLRFRILDSFVYMITRDKTVGELYKKLRSDKPKVWKYEDVDGAEYVRDTTMLQYIEKQSQTFEPVAAFTEFTAIVEKILGIVLLQKDIRFNTRTVYPILTELLMLIQSSLPSGNPHELRDKIDKLLLELDGYIHSSFLRNIERQLYDKPMDIAVDINRQIHTLYLNGHPVLKPETAYNTIQDLYGALDTLSAILNDTSELVGAVKENQNTSTIKVFEEVLRNNKYFTTSPVLAVILKTNQFQRAAYTHVLVGAHTNNTCSPKQTDKGMSVNIVPHGNHIIAQIITHMSCNNKTPFSDESEPEIIRPITFTEICLMDERGQVVASKLTAEPELENEWTEQQIHDINAMCKANSFHVQTIPEIPEEQTIKYVSSHSNTNAAETDDTDDEFDNGNGGGGGGGGKHSPSIGPAGVQEEQVQEVQDKDGQVVDQLAVQEGSGRSLDSTPTVLGENLHAINPDSYSRTFTKAANVDSDGVDSSTVSSGGETSDESVMSQSDIDARATAIAASISQAKLDMHNAKILFNPEKPIPKIMLEILETAQKTTKILSANPPIRIKAAQDALETLKRQSQELKGIMIGLSKRERDNIKKSYKMVNTVIVRVTEFVNDMSGSEGGEPTGDMEIQEDDGGGSKDSNVSSSSDDVTPGARKLIDEMVSKIDEANPTPKPPSRGIPDAEMPALTTDNSIPMAEVADISGLLDDYADILKTSPIRNGSTIPLNEKTILIRLKFEAIQFKADIDFIIIHILNPRTWQPKLKSAKNHFAEISKVYRDAQQTMSDEAMREYIETVYTNTKQIMTNIHTIVDRVAPELGTQLRGGFNSESLFPDQATIFRALGWN